MLERLPVHSSFFCNLCLKGVTFVLTAAHGHLLGLPVDLWVVLLEPGEAQDDILLSVKDGILRWFRFRVSDPTGLGFNLCVALAL